MLHEDTIRARLVNQSSPWDHPAHTSRMQDADRQVMTKQPDIGVVDTQRKNTDSNGRFWGLFISATPHHILLVSPSVAIVNIAANEHLFVHTLLHISSIAQSRRRRRRSAVPTAPDPRHQTFYVLFVQRGSTSGGTSAGVSVVQVRYTRLEGTDWTFFLQRRFRFT